MGVLGLLSVSGAFEASRRMSHGISEIFQEVSGYSEFPSSLLKNPGNSLRR